jgi:hypothetical protein
VLDLEPIGRAWSCYELDSDMCASAVGHIPALIAEVESLREQHAELIAFLVSVPSSMQCACGRTVTLDVGSD